MGGGGQQQSSADPNRPNPTGTGGLDPTKTNGPLQGGPRPLPLSAAHATFSSPNLAGQGGEALPSLGESAPVEPPPETKPEGDGEGTPYSGYEPPAEIGLGAA